jgi:hypothetical protein
MLTGHQLISSFPSVAAKELWSVEGPYMDVAINPMRDPATARKALLSMLRQVGVGGGLRWEGTGGLSRVGCPKGRSTTA